MYEQLRMNHKTITLTTAFVNTLKNMGLITKRQAIDCYVHIFSKHHDILRNLSEASKPGEE